ncbi:MAG: hypothetical protein AAB152_09885 [Candidatus Coatesbacteria bacterium]
MVQSNVPKDGKRGQGPKPIAPQTSKLMEYVYVNLIFWGFLVLLCLAVYVDCAVSGVVKFGDAPDEVMWQVCKFILLVFGLGFSAVSVFDWLYDRYAGDQEAAEAAK